MTSYMKLATFLMMCTLSSALRVAPVQTSLKEETSRHAHTIREQDDGLVLDTVLDGVDAPAAQRNRWFDLGAWGTFFQDSAKQAPLAEEVKKP